MNHLVEVISSSTPRRQPGRFRYGRVTAINTSVSPHLYTVDGRAMPMLLSGVTVTDLVLYWDDAHDPVGFGTPQGA